LFRANVSFSRSNLPQGSRRHHPDNLPKNQARRAKARRTCEERLREARERRASASPDRPLIPEEALALKKRRWTDCDFGSALRHRERKAESRSGSMHALGTHFAAVRF